MWAANLGIRLRIVTIVIAEVVVVELALFRFVFLALVTAIGRIAEVFVAEAFLDFFVVVAPTALIFLVRLHSQRRCHLLRDRTRT